MARTIQEPPVIDAIREWLGLALTGVVALATATTAYFFWRERQPLVEFNATKEASGILRCELAFTNKSSHKVVTENFEITSPDDATIFARGSYPVEGQTTLRLNREVAPNDTATSVFYVNSDSPIRELRAIFSVSRRLRTIRTSRYTIKRTIND